MALTCRSIYHVFTLRYASSELYMGPISSTQPIPTRDITDMNPTKPTDLKI